MKLVKLNPDPPALGAAVWVKPTDSVAVGASSPESSAAVLRGAALCRLPPELGAPLAASSARDSWVLPPKAGAGVAGVGVGVAGISAVLWLLGLSPGALSCSA